MKRVALLCATAFLLASCDDSSSSESGACDSSQRDPLVVGIWAPVINVGGQYFDFHTLDSGKVHLRGGFINDSIPFAYSAACGTITMTTDGKTSSGTYRFFGKDSVEIKVSTLFQGLATRIDAVPVPTE